MNQKRITDFFASPIPVNLSSISYGETSSLSKQTSSLSISSPNTSRPRSRKRRINVEDDPSQLMLDAGQKKLGLEHCKECGMVYSVDTIKDVNLHKDFHNRACETKFFRVTTAQLKTWKSQLYSEVVASKFNGTLFRLNGQTKSTLKNKTEIIIKEILNVELGFCEDISTWDAEGKRSALVFVLEDPSVLDKENLFIASVLLVELVEQVFLMPMNKEFRGKFIGVNRIWVHRSLRRQGLAKMMLDLARRLFSDGEMLPKTRIAFSEPTEDGEKLAIGYLDDKENKRFISYCL